jgi:hypothetical protein
MRAGLMGGLLFAATAVHAGTPWSAQLRAGNNQSVVASPAGASRNSEVQSGGGEPLIAAHPLEFSGAGQFAVRHRPDEPLLGPEPASPPSAGWSIGPIRAEGFTGQMGKGGKARFRPHYRLEGVTVLGGSVGGSVDTRGGMVTLNWQTGH